LCLEPLRAPILVAQYAEPTVLDLDPLFFDPSGDFEFTVSSSDPTVVSPVLAERRLVLDYAEGGMGEARVAVVAAAGGVLAACGELAVAVVDGTQMVGGAGDHLAIVGDPYTLTLDPLGHDVVEWVVDWGDGTTQSYMPPPGGTTITVSHVYTRRGDCLVMVRARTWGGPWMPAPALPVKAAAPAMDPWLFRVKGARAAEKDEGATEITFTITLVKASTQDIEVTYKTFDGTAKADERDYVPVAATKVTFKAGETEKKVKVSINGDRRVEPDEEFFLVLEVPPFTQDGKPSSPLTPFGRGFIVNDDFPEGTTDPWAKWEQDPDYTPPDSPYEMGAWRKGVDVGNKTTTMMPPQGPPWSPSLVGKPPAGEGPYLRTSGDVGVYGKFLMTIDWKPLDGEAVPPRPLTDKGEVREVKPNAQHFSNGGVYVYKRYEVQVNDPRKFGKKNGDVIEDVPPPDGSKKTQVLPGGLYGVIPETSDFKSRVKDNGDWNSLEIAFTPGDPAGDPARKESAAFAETKLNGEPVWKGPLIEDGKALNGTGQQRAAKPMLKSGRIYLQSHWGSQVEFRKPVIEKKD
ncbi:MAG TPA: Calx-beta domain-containing protein, partial [Vicinamibacteria bacterium]